MPESLKTTSVKDEVLAMIQRLPPDCTLEEIQYHLYIRQLVAEGLADAEAGNTIPHEEAKRRMREWLKSRGLQKH